MLHQRVSSFYEALFFLSYVIFPFTVVLLNSQARCSSSLNKRTIRFPYGAEDLVRYGIINTPDQWTNSRLYPTATQPIIPTEDVRAEAPGTKRRKLDTSVLSEWDFGKEEFEVERHPSKLTRSRTFPPRRSPNYEEPSHQILSSEMDRGMVFKAYPKFRSLDPQHLKEITTERGPMKALEVEDLPIEALSITSEKEDLRKSIQTALDKLTYNLPSLEFIKLDSPQLKHLEIYELQELESILKGLQAQLELGQSQQLQIQKRLDDLSRKLQTSSQSSQLPHNADTINNSPMDHHTAASQSTEPHSRMEIIMLKLNQFVRHFDANFEADPSLINVDQHQYSITLIEIFEIIQRNKISSTELNKNIKSTSISEKELELKNSLQINQDEWKSIQDTTFWIRSLIPTYKNAQNALRSKLSHLDSWYETIQKKF
ncbi:uncharacterized protein MELLADRAFT_106178 [Melampsora larici-populina 98AG31]|uniref:Uncharacterized protein n=1 Tax=Melampsora larici-populina (strain 98AG31 / pathotype 3-4-7) TaxID=747676 RepID=F4RKN5_MELLP|nr:uncharacterized protein MELLADRAFT_106178 [Melampsora larici-populina 98AG31]EGG07123.1 hypothetical protein MELLADRAFT_106178 [Melampsora larici-populina 98AG31]